MVNIFSENAFDLQQKRCCACYHVLARRCPVLAQTIVDEWGTTAGAQTSGVETCPNTAALLVLDFRQTDL